MPIWLFMLRRERSGCGYGPARFGRDHHGNSYGGLSISKFGLRTRRYVGCERSFSFDVGAACSGFLNALSVADSFIRLGKIRNALVVGSDALSRLLNWQDRTTCILFGDGAGAVVLGASENGNGILSTKLRTDGSYAKTLYVPAGGSLSQPIARRWNETSIPSL